MSNLKKPTCVLKQDVLELATLRYVVDKSTNRNKKTLKRSFSNSMFIQFKFWSEVNMLYDIQYIVRSEECKSGGK